MSNYDDMELLMVRYLANEISSDEYQKLKDWMESDPSNTRKFREWEKIYNQEYHVQESFSWEDALNRLHERIDGDRKSAKVKKLDIRIFNRVAAVITVLLFSSVLFFLLENQLNEVEYVTALTKQGQKATVQLPDGSVVRLNSASKLVYPEKFDNDERRVTLEGEGFFKVQRDEQKPFIVVSSDIKVKVLGTSFNVMAYPDENIATVTVESGKVQVQKAIDSLILLANQQVSISLDSNKIEFVDNADPADMAWKENVLWFENNTFLDVEKKLERWYGVEIEIKNPQDISCRITGKFEDESLTNVLEAISFSTGLKYESKNDKIIIKGDGCK